jgi:hypothetical protein
MGSPSVPAGEPSGRHEKVTAFVSRAAASAEQKTVLPGLGADLDAFGSEEPKRAQPAAAAPKASLLSRRTLLILGLAGAALLAAAAAAVFAPSLLLQAPATTPGRVTITTAPMGTEVSVDGQVRGLTPLTFQLDPGAHLIRLRRDSNERTISLNVAAGADVTQHYEFAPQAAPAAQTSTLSITTDPPGARVLVDGEAHGTSPVTVADLSVALHRVTVIGELGSVERQVTTEAGVTSSVVFALPRAPAVSAGWLAVASPFEVQVVERGDVIGTSASPRFMVPAGVHEVDLVNEALGFNEHRRIEISQGATAPLKIDARAVISANARPWADVLVDGRSVGQTPIANLSLTLGSHEIVFRHPDLGERRQVIVVTARGPNRIAVDLTR